MKAYFFTAAWCGACKQMAPTITQVRKEGYKIQTVDVDADSQLATKHKIVTLPTTIGIKSNLEIFRFVGPVSLEKLREVLKKDLDYKVW